MSRTGSMLGQLRDSLRTQLWPLPSIGVVAGGALGVGLPRLDARIDGDLPPGVTAYLFGGGAGAARTVLDAIASSLITVTSLTFSLTVVTLQLASSQFSPRLLRTFSRDRFVHATLALFLGTFTYALTVLRTVRDGGGSSVEFAPQVSVTVGFALAIASVLGLVLFLAHLATEIRVETMLRNVHRDAKSTVRRVLAELGAAAEYLPVPPTDAEPVPAASSGFLVQIDERALLSAAVDGDAMVLIDRPPGCSLLRGVPLGVTWPRAGGSFHEDTLIQLRKRVSEAVEVNFERTEVIDVGYGLRQLSDVATKALSPGINDPTTAIHAIGHISDLLCDLAGRDLGDRVLLDAQGTVRVVLRRLGLPDLIEAAIDQPRRYGHGDPLVLARLFALLREVAWSVSDPVHRQAVAEQLDRTKATAEAQDFDSVDRARIARHADLVQDALAGVWTV